MRSGTDVRRYSGGAKASRFWQIDVARGIAMLMVILYHFVYDLDNFVGLDVESTSGFWAVFADVSAFAFVFIVGMSLEISYSRSSVPAGRGLFGKYLLRGLGIFGCGMLITLVFWVLSLGAVIFGILHLIGLSIILAYAFLRLRYANLLVGLFVIAAGLYLGGQNVVAGGVAGVLLSPFGVVPEGLFMPDYRPLLPWFGVVLLGMFFGRVVYVDRGIERPSGPGPRYAAPLAFVGRHTLIIYLIHQPVLISALWVLGSVGT